MPVIPKDPQDWLNLFRQQINEVFSYLTDLERREKFGEHEFTPLLDIYETSDAFIVELDLPGFENTDISLSICCNMLVVEGTKRKDERGQEMNFICIERNFGRFRRTIEIPPSVDIGGVKAKYEKGVLTVNFPLVRDKSTFIRVIPIEQGE